MRAPHEHPADPALLGWIFAAAMAKCGARVCSWCRKFMGLARELGEGELTHGICPACEAGINAEAEELFSRARASGNAQAANCTKDAQLAGAAVFEEAKL